MDFDVKAISELAIKAGVRAKEIYDKKEYFVTYKPDNTPVTGADLTADRIIAEGLKELYPKIPLISEEEPAAPYEERRSWRYAWLVDPIDGTREFINRNGEFTVNIGLVESHRPVMGVIYLPVPEVLYYADASGSYKKLPGQEPREIHTPKDVDLKNLRAVMTRSNFREPERLFVKRNHIRHCRQVGSSIKFCLVAEGSADVYYQEGRTHEWDTAAGQAIVERAGGMVVGVKREPLRYNKESLLNTPYLCTGSDSSLGLMF